MRVLWSFFRVAAAATFTLPACQLVVGGDDKVLVDSISTNGGGGNSAVGGEGGATSEPAGAGGTGAGGFSGVSAKGGAGLTAGRGGHGGKATAGSGGAGTGGTTTAGAGGSTSGAGGGGSPGTGGGGAAGSGGAPPGQTAPGQIDCEKVVPGTYRYCTDFSPIPAGWETAGCSSRITVGANTVWRWEQPAAVQCATFVSVTLGTKHTAVTMSLWVRLDGFGIADDDIALMRVDIGAASGQLVLRADRDAGKIVGTTLLVQTREPTPQTKVVGAFPNADWRHLKLRVTSAGQVSGSLGVRTDAVLTEATVAGPAGAAAAPYLELPFKQTAPGTAPTAILLDDLTITVTD